MAFLTADVVPSDDDEQPFKVVFMRAGDIIAEWLVDSQEEGEEQLLEAVKELGAAEDEDEEKDDDEEEEDDEEGGDEDKDEDDDDKPKRGKR
jgi:phosphopantothenoylcysteine synthetase/decarboxylase